jgi:transglutaminase-like putative cysteine protease
MTIMKRTLLLLITFMTSFAVMAQDFPYGRVDKVALDMKKYDKDTSAHAVVLNEYGTTRINFTNDYHISMSFEYHTQIKFFDNKEFEREGTFEIPIYNGSDMVYEQVEDVKGITYYKDDNGIVQQVALDSKKVFRVKDSKHWNTVKFAMPALRNGCVIEVSYRVTSPYDFNFHSWYFQGYIPKVNSEYEVHIPGFWNYNASLKGHLKLTKNTAKVESKCFSYGTASADCSDIIYGISNVPAFIEEDYMTSEKNYRSAVNFQLEEETDFTTGAKIKYAKSWKDLDYLLKTENTFGGQLKRKSLMSEKIAPVIANKTDQLEKAKAIYVYIKNSVRWNEGKGFSSEDGIKQAIENHTGNSGDINLALVAALNAAGITTEAVLLSTREHGNLNKLYPNLEDFNYVIAKANIGEKSYLLDATDALLPFGMLPLRCLNDQGRVFSLDKPSYWIDMTTQQRENVTYALDLTLQDNGKLRGTVTRFSSGYSGYLKRREIKKYNSIDEYVEHIELKNIKILKSDIANLDSLDQPLGETYEVEMNQDNDLNHGRLTFSPFLLNQLTTNPFKLAEREYPVDWGMPSDERYIVNIHLPAQYSIENPPQGVAFALPNQGGKFFTSFESGNQTFTFSYDTRLDKSVYSPEEYPYLKELYNKIILTEKNEIVFKKKS